MPVNFPESTLQADPIGASDLRAVGEFKAPKADGGHQRVLDWTRRLQAADCPIPVPILSDQFRQSSDGAVYSRHAEERQYIGVLLQGNVRYRSVTLFAWPTVPKCFQICFRGFKPDSDVELDLGNHSERAIEQWSLDHHVLTFPFRHNIPQSDLKQRDMIEKHKSLLLSCFESTATHFVGEPLTKSDALSTMHYTTIAQSTPAFTCEGATILEQAQNTASRNESPFQGAATTLGVWTYIDRWLVGFTEETLFTEYHYLSGQIEANITGCRELDSVLTKSFGSKIGLEDLAHKHFRARAVAHREFLSNNYLGSTLRSGNSPPGDEAFSTWCHTMRITSALDGLDRTPTEVEAMKRHLRYSDLELRLKNDPIYVFVDGAITLSADSFFAGLSLPASTRTHITHNPFFDSLGTGTAAVHLPILLVKHQTEASELTDGTVNAQRVCICSAVYFLKTLGIQDFPVYGLATCGTRAFLSQAWYSRENDCCYVLDRGIRGEAFDLATEEGSRRFFCFRTRLRRHVKSLEQHLDSNRKDIEAYLAAAPLSVFQWSMVSQLHMLRNRREKGGSK